MSGSALPLADARALDRERNRTRRIRVGLAAALVATVLGAFFASRGSSTNPAPVLPPGSSGVIVLDLSISVENATLSRMYSTLTQLSVTKGRYGLVLVSSRAYEALPPNTPARELASFARFFHGSASSGSSAGFNGNGAPPSSQNAFSSQNRDQFLVYPPNPWACCFSFGTELSTGLKLARSLVMSAGTGRRAVWLISDLADDPADRPTAAAVIRSYVAPGIALHVIGLDPTPANGRFFAGLVGKRGGFVRAQPAAQARPVKKAGFPVALTALGGLLALLLAANERLSTILQWGRG